jgi:hypothetical protein
MDSKNQFYNRPVLIMRKFNPHIFFGVPLTTKIKQNPYYLERVAKWRLNAIPEG